MIRPIINSMIFHLNLLILLISIKVFLKLHLFIYDYKKSWKHFDLRNSWKLENSILCFSLRLHTNVFFWHFDPIEKTYDLYWIILNSYFKWMNLFWFFIIIIYDLEWFQKYEIDNTLQYSWRMKLKISYIFWKIWKVIFSFSMTLFLK